MYAPIGWHLCRTGRITPQLSVGNTRPVVSLSLSKIIDLVSHCVLSKFLLLETRSGVFFKRLENGYLLC